MIYRRKGSDWDGIPKENYKDEPGTWVGVGRRNLSADAGTAFEVRYFDVQPGGYTSFEKHVHEHFVVVLDGEGEVRLGDEWFAIHVGDAVHVPPSTPHQFRNTGSGTFGILCTVNKERDRPVLLPPDSHSR